VPPVLVTGATGRVGRGVVDLLIDAGVPVRALTRRSEAEAALPASTRTTDSVPAGSNRAAGRPTSMPLTAP